MRVLSYQSGSSGIFMGRSRARVLGGEGCSLCSEQKVLIWRERDGAGGGGGMEGWGGAY